MFDTRSPHDSARPRVSSIPDGFLVGLFSGTLLLSAGLLFWIQPLVGKLLLPMLGGAPAVWNAAMLFFQAGLLLGYAYAHVTSLWLKPHHQALLHLVLLGACLAWLPIGISGGVLSGIISDHPPIGIDPVWWLLGVLSLGIGVPFSMLSASAPILQRWFAASGHADAVNPYFLYAASNLGSVAALLGFPFVAEPLLDLAGQSHIWSLSFVVLLALTGVCAFAALRHTPRTVVAPILVAPTAPPMWRQRLHWMALVFVTTSLMLGLTTYITMDVAAVPLLWVVPLTLYLLTFVIAFARRALVTESFVRVIFVLTLIPFVRVWSIGIHGLMWPVWAFYLAVLLFVTALSCHLILARLRPHSAWLTDFYLWMAIGGVLGGAFNALVAPLLFDTVLELPIMLVMAVALVIGFPQTPRSVTYTVLSTALIFALGGALTYASILDRHNPNILLAQRNFFGTLKVAFDPDVGVRSLFSGSTIHGTQATDPNFVTEPLSYYGRSGPVGDVFSDLDARTLRAASTVPTQVGVIGLGVGTVACYRAPNRRFTFFEINPVVTQIAENTDLFTFLSNCPDYAVVEGDGRLSLGREPQGKYDLLFMDAFTSDSIPIHMLTREAVEMYLDKLAPTGLLAIHISNRHLDLAPVVGAISRDLGLATVAYIPDWGGARYQTIPGTQLQVARTDVVVLARGADQLADLVARPGWHVLEQPPGRRAWTDDYSNILAALR